MTIRRLLFVLIVALVMLQRDKIDMLMRYAWVRFYDHRTGIQPGRPLREVVR